MPINARGWKAVATVGLLVGIFGVLAGGIGRSFSADLAALHAAIGIFLGGMAGPLMEPSGFRYPRLWQIAAAVVGCCLFALSLEASVLGYGLAVIIGSALGYSANYWLPYASP